MARIRCEHWVTKEEAQALWQKKLETAGYKTTEEYQDDLFPKYGAVEPLYSELTRPGARTFNNVRIIELGKISEIISDITLKGATEDEIKRMVKYSMVLIDGEKHNLDYKKAKEDLGIDKIILKYYSGRYPWK